MKSNVCRSVVVFLALLVPNTRVMALLEFKGGGTYVIDYPSNGDVRVDYNASRRPTTVNIVQDGHIDTLIEYFEFSRGNVLGGWTHVLRGFDYSLLTVTDGRVINIETADQSNLSITGGSVETVVAMDDSQVAISGGVIERLLIAMQGSHIRVTGGVLEENSDLRVDNWAVIEIVGSNFLLNEEPIDYGEIHTLRAGNYWDEPDRWLAGTLENGDSFESLIHIGHGGRIVLVPEPNTLLLLGVGGLGILRRRESFQRTG